MRKLGLCIIAAILMSFVLLSTAATGSAAPTLESPGDTVSTNDNTPDFEWTPDSENDDAITIKIDDTSDILYLILPSPLYENNLGTGHPASHTLPDDNALSDGTYYWQIVEENDGSSSIWSFTVDTTKPTVTITVSPNPTSEQSIDGLTLKLVFSESMDTSVEPTVTYDPEGETTAQACTGGSWSTTTNDNDTYTVANDVAITATIGDGTATISVSGARDLAANVMLDDTDDSFTIDTVAPALPAIAISEGDITNTTSITLTLSAENATEIWVGGDVVDDEKTNQWISYATTLSVTLSPDSGSKTVRVRFRDAANNQTSFAENKIVLSVPATAAPSIDFMLLLVSGAVFFVGGIAVGWKAFGGRGEIVRPEGPKPRVSDRQAHDAMGGADDDTRRAGGMLKEASGLDVDVSTEQELLKKAQEFEDTARKDYRDGRHDSAYAYATSASALGTGITSTLKEKMEEARGAAEARRKAEVDIRAAEAAVKEVRSSIGEAESTGIDAEPATSLADLASEIMKGAGAAKDPETYRFQSSTAKRIAEHAAASLKGSIAGQKDQVKRTEEALAGAKGALGKAEASIEKGRKEFDTLIPEYWLEVAKEVYSIAGDKKLNAEAREAMADTSTKICEWIGDMFERRDVRGRLKKGKGITLR